MYILFIHVQVTNFFVLTIHPKSQVWLAHARCYCAACVCYLDGTLHLHVCACMLMHTAAVCMLSRQCFAPSVNAVTLMALSFCYMILMNKCYFVPFDQVKCVGATCTHAKLYSNKYGIYCIYMTLNFVKVNKHYKKCFFKLDWSAICSLFYISSLSHQFSPYF